MSELYSAPGEKLEEHLEKVFETWNSLKARLLPSLTRLVGDEKRACEAVELALAFHDLGKLTEQWQRKAKELWFKKVGAEGREDEEIGGSIESTIDLEPLEELEEEEEAAGEGGKGERIGVPHAFLGGCYLTQVAEKLGNRDEIFASAFAVAIHHLDSGLVAPSLEQPDVLAVRHRIVDDDTDLLKWSFDDTKGLPSFIGDLKVDGSRVLEIVDPLKMTIHDLARASETLRNWALVGNILERHRRRILASALHSIIKVCDIRASSSRGGEISRFTKKILEGGLIV